MKKDDQVTIPLNGDQENSPAPYEFPPVYEHPKIDFNSGWKDRGFAIAFGIHVIIVIALAFTLGVPVLVKTVNSSDIKILQTLIGENSTPFLLGLASTVGMGTFASLFTLFLLRICNQHFIRNAFIFITVLLVGLMVSLFFVHFSLCFLPGIFLFIILIYICCVRRRISFSEAHLQAGCAALNSHGSLVLIAFLMIIIQFVWLLLSGLMIIGVQDKFSSLFPVVNETLSDSTNANSEGGTQSWARTALSAPLILSLLWGTLTIGNIAHFISACCVGHWWYTSDAREQYTMGNSVKRAFTTNFGTICFGSLFEAFIKTLRSIANPERKNNILACIVSCILLVIEKIVGYLNEWAFIYSALTGQSYVESGKSFIDLFKKRGWTMIINDSIISTTLGIINILLGMVTAAAGGIIMWLFVPKTEVAIVGIITVSLVGFLIGLNMSIVITTTLLSCVRSVFVCFALHPSALGATHPEHLERLSHVWHKYYPKEFADSGYAQHLPEKMNV